MRHLSAEQLVDFVEGIQRDSSSPHLASCDACRRQLAELRAILISAADNDVPEPSPLFWDYLSARVREAVEAEGVPRRPPALARLLRPAYAGAFAIAVVAVVTVLGVTFGWSTRGGRRPTAGSIDVSAVAAIEHSQGLEPASGGDTLDAADDLSLMVVADLADLDLDTARDAGLAAGGSADRAVAHLNSGELRELRRLLQMELGRRGAQS